MTRAFSIGALLLSGALGCGAPAEPSTPPSPPTAHAAALPSSVEEARALRGKGVSWTWAEIRDHYLSLVTRIGTANDEWKKAGVGAEERARRAFKIRYDARVLSRAMMSDAKDVELMESRDQRRYGHPDGPTFEELVEKEKKNGRAGDAVYEAIIASAQRTDPIVNELVGPSEK